MARYGAILGFVICATAAITQAWSLPLFCWSTWLAAYSFSLLAMGISVIRLVLTPPRWPIVASLSQWQQTLCVRGGACAMGFSLFFVYTYLFGFYGILLSVFAAMEPATLFGPNGFINSDFWTPVAYLCDRLWPMLLGTVIANIGSLFKGTPTQGLALIGQRVIRVHLLTVLMPFMAILAWLLFPNRYQPIAIVMLMALFYFLPQQSPATLPEQSSATPPEAA